MAARRGAKTNIADIGPHRLKSRTFPQFLAFWEGTLKQNIARSEVSLFLPDMGRMSTQGLGITWLEANLQGQRPMMGHASVGTALGLSLRAAHRGWHLHGGMILECSLDHGIQASLGTRAPQMELPLHDLLE